MFVTETDCTTMCDGIIFNLEHDKTLRPSRSLALIKEPCGKGKLEISDQTRHPFTYMTSDLSVTGVCDTGSLHTFLCFKQLYICLWQHKRNLLSCEIKYMLNLCQAKLNHSFTLRSYTDTETHVFKCSGAPESVNVIFSVLTRLD